jgi:hypothetical protein
MRYSRYMQALTFSSALLLASSCGDTDATLAPTDAAAASGGVVVTATVASAIAEPAGNAFCPSVAPFTLPVGVMVQPTGDSPVVVTSVRMVFTDTSGFQAPAVTIPMPTAPAAPGPTPVFGTSIQGVSQRFPLQRFPFSLGIGCGTGIRGTVVIVVETAEANGRRGSSRVTVTVN